MNELIKELAEQAGLPNADYYVQAVIGPRDIQKFAELVAKKCAEMADTLDGQSDYWLLFKSQFGSPEMQELILAKLVEQPAPEPDVVHTIKARASGLCIRIDSVTGCVSEANLKLTFDGETGKLKSAEVI